MYIIYMEKNDNIQKVATNAKFDKSPLNDVFTDLTWNCLLFNANIRY